MKKTLLSVASATILTMVVNTNLFALGASKTIEDQRMQKIDLIAQKESTIADKVAEYIIQTLDTSVTRAKLQEKYWINFVNYRNQDCTKDTNSNCLDNGNNSGSYNGIGISVDTSTDYFTLHNSLGDTSRLSSTELSYYENGTVNKSAYGQNSPDLSKIRFPFSSFTGLRETINAINEYNAETNASYILSATTPTGEDKKKMWKKPNGDGTFEYLIYDGKSKWINRGHNELKFYIGDAFNPEETAGAKGLKAIVETLDGVVEYVHNGTKWVSTTIGVKGKKVFYDERLSSINDLLNRTDEKLFDAVPPSSGVIFNIFGATSLKFIRKLHYWESEVAINIPSYKGSGAINAKIFVADKLGDLPTYGVEDGDIAYLVSNNDIGYKGSHSNYEAIYLDGFDGGVSGWVYSVPDYTKLLSEAKSEASTKYYVVAQKLVLESQGKASESSSIYPYWKTYNVDYSDIPMVYITKGDRNDLIDAETTNLTDIYLTSSLGNDLRYTTNGVSYSGDSSLKQWFYSSTGTTTNSLLDAIPISSNPYNGHSDANSVGYAIWGNDLMHKDGSLWKYSSNNSNYNPCSSGWSVDYPNLRCSNTYNVPDNYNATRNTNTQIIETSCYELTGILSGSCGTNAIWVTAGSCSYKHKGDNVDTTRKNCVKTTYSYSCPHGGTLSGTTCLRTKSQTDYKAFSSL